jgi:hypothetical protein
MTIPNTSFTPTVTFPSGTYPNQVIQSSEYNKLIDNAYTLTRKFMSFSTQSASTSMSNASFGTWSILTGCQFGSISPVDPNRGYMLAFHAQVRSSAAVANKLRFSILVSGTSLPPSGIGDAARLSANIGADRLISIFQYVPASVITAAGVTGLAFGWTIELSTPTITYTLPSGFKFSAFNV